MFNSILKILASIIPFIVGIFNKRNSPNEITKRKKIEADKAIATSDIKSINLQLESGLRGQKSSSGDSK